MNESSQSKFDVKEIQKLLPHRYPFLLIDKIHEIDMEKGTITAQKNLTINEAFFQGHFPDAPIMPGVLILEAMAQAGGVLVYLKNNPDVPTIAVLMNIKNAKFRTPVKPGDVLIIKCNGLHFSSKSGRIEAFAYVEDKVVCQAEMSFALVNKELI